MKRRDFLKNSAITGSLMTGMNLPLNTSQETGNAIAAEMKKYHSVVAIAASNDPELAEPMPLHVPLTTQQIQDIVWLALDRDYSPRLSWKRRNRA